MGETWFPLRERAGGERRLSPLERPLLPDVDVGDGEDDDEEPELRYREPPDLLEDDGDRIEEHDLDIEDDEEHGRQVEADRETLLLHWSLRDAGLERNRLSPSTSSRACGENEAHDDHRGWDGESDQPVDEKRKPVVERGQDQTGSILAFTSGRGACGKKGL